jgi:lipopolysaccharide/colanic/teichoic acid biosynthesis glycosyltransferase
MSRLLILGAGGHAKVVTETALASGVASSLAFLDDRCMGSDPWPPVLAILAWQLRSRLGSLVFSCQLSPGMRGKPFRIVKFRTMRDAIGPDGKLLPDAERMTPFGCFLRASSLDDLTELWNVLKGDMSFIGPRPLLMGYLPLYTPEQARRHEVRPGITGWAQVNGLKTISWEEKFRLDVWYVDHQSFLLDLRILFLKLLKVTRREGISADGEATLTPFAGTAQ